MDKKIKILGIASIALGIISSLLCILPYGIFLALPIGFAGMLASVIYVYIDTKNEINKKKITPGVIGIALSSIPILIVLTIIIMSRFK